MTDQPMSSSGTLMRRWMIAVGIFSLLLGIGLLPWVNDARIGGLGLDALYAGGDLTIVVHLVVIVTGVWVLRRTPSRSEVEVW